MRCSSDDPSYPLVTRLAFNYRISSWFHGLDPLVGHCSCWKRHYLKLGRALQRIYLQRCQENIFHKCACYWNNLPSTEILHKHVTAKATESRKKSASRVSGGKHLSKQYLLQFLDPLLGPQNSPVSIVLTVFLIQICRSLQMALQYPSTIVTFSRESGLSSVIRLEPGTAL